MGGEEDVVEGEQRRIRGWRLLVEDVEAGAGDPARGQGIVEGRLVDGCRVGGVEDVGVGVTSPSTLPGSLPRCYPLVRRFVMPKSTSVILDEHLVGFIDRQIEEGRYRSTSEVVRAALQLLEEHEAKLEALRGALIEGEQSGASEPFDFDAFIKGRRSADR